MMINHCSYLFSIAAVTRISCQKTVNVIALVFLRPALLLLSLLLLSTGCSTSETKMIPKFDGQLAPCPTSPNCVSSLASDEAHYVEPFVLTGTSTDCWAAIVSTVKALPRTQIMTETPDYLHAEVRSRLFRFVDHFELAVASDKHRIDIRSASVTGHSDMGVNRERVEMLRDSLTEKGICKATHKTR